MRQPKSLADEIILDDVDDLCEIIRIVQKDALEGTKFEHIGLIRLRDLEKTAIASALLIFDEKEAAKSLGISRSCLYRKMEEYRIEK